MDENVVKNLEELANKASFNGVEFSCPVSPEDFAGFLHRMADWIGEKAPDALSMTIDWNGLTARVKLSFGDPDQDAKL